MKTAYRNVVSVYHDPIFGSAPAILPVLAMLFSIPQNNSVVREYRRPERKKPAMVYRTREIDLQSHFY